MTNPVSRPALIAGAGFAPPTTASAASRAAMSIPDFCAWSGIGRTTVFDEIKTGRLQAVKLGRRTLIRVADAEAWLASLPTREAAA